MNENLNIPPSDMLIVKCVRAGYAALMENAKDHPQPHEVLFRAAILIAARAISGAGRLDQTAAIANLNAFVEGVAESLKHYYPPAKNGISR